MEIVPAPAPARRDLTVMQSVLQARILMIPNSPPVHTGTPLIIDGGAWRITKPGETPQMFAMTFAYGGEQVDAARGLVVETHVRSLTPGRCKIRDVQAPGALEFINDPAGPFVALNRSQVLLG